ncbi:ABC transporter substrate-binding protein [Kineosporia sp. R_H_3]|uniref:ABC transporter substrate-binding protein n=1 Tax=Kineosporia sp. R_H_3 TaxID=1961848 RepID=UPI000B4ADC99|nr:ABC transporter substrate-binding protein [Kineosporia sp. R_H_3]
MPRIVSLLPSTTEWVHALGLESDLVGVTFECDTPPDPRVGRAVVVGGLDTAGLAPGEIDALVRAKVAAGEDLYTLDTDAMARLAPEVVLTQDLCRVCALPADAAREAVERIGCPGTVLTFDPHTLAEVLDGATEVAAACGAADAGTALRAALQARLDAVSLGVAARPRPRVLVLEWTDPPFVAGHWVPDLVAAAGGVPVLARAGERSVPASWDDVRAAVRTADAVLVAPCGYGLADAVAQAHAVVGVLGADLPAACAVHAVDAGGFVTRPGPRVVDAVEALAAAWHPAAASAAGVTPRPGVVAAVRPA